MIAFPGTIASVQYTVESSGVLAAAASGPTYTLYKNGSVVDTTSGTPTVTLTTTNPVTGVYRVSFTVPALWAANDVIELFAATGSTGSAFVGRWVVMPASLLSVPAFPANFAALGINASGHVSRVSLVDTTTINTDMRGTDDAYTGTPPTVEEIRQEMDTGSVRLGDIVGVTDQMVTAGGSYEDRLLEILDIEEATLGQQLAIIMGYGYDAKVGTAVDVGLISTAGTGTEIYTYGGMTVTCEVDETGNRTSVVVT